MAHKHEQKSRDGRPRIVIVGAGFGGLWTAKALKRANADVVLIDRNNYHTFLPLLYQVAAAELAPSQIGHPVRGMLRKLPNADFVMAEVERIDPDEQLVISAEGEHIHYDYLVLSTGSVATFFGIPGADIHCFTMKSMNDGIVLRNHILSQFELASHETNEARRRQLLTFVVIGGGPSGVEYAGALMELIKGPLKRDFPKLDMAEARVVLIEAADNVLRMLSDRLGEYAVERLEKMGVEVMLHAAVNEVREDAVVLKDGNILESVTAIWTAGVGGEGLGRRSDIETARNATIPVEQTLQVPGYSNMFAIGDLASFEQDGERLPMVAPVAMQMGEHVAENLQHLINDEPLEEFVYFDKGSMAVIGRNSAVAEIAGRGFTGFFAWLIWLVIHIIQLIGFHSRVQVLINWSWSYLRFEYVVRLIQPTFQHTVQKQEPQLVPPEEPAPVDAV